MDKDGETTDMGGRQLRTLAECCVVIAILAGGVLAVRSGSERSRLRAEYRRLVSVVGEITIGDPDKVWLAALDTGDPMHFAWRVYLPAGYRLHLQYDGGSRSSWSSDPREFVARVRFREGADGRLEVYTDFGSGSSRSSRGEATVGDFLRDHWDRLEVEQFGSGGTVWLDPQESATLLRIRLPEDLQQRAETELPGHLQTVVFPEFYKITLGQPRSAP